MNDEADPLVRKTVSLPASVWKRIEDFQFANRIKRETEAVRRVVEIGLATEAKKRKPQSGA